MAKQSGFSILSTLNPQSLPGEERAANEFVVEMIPLEEIEPNADNFYNTEDIEALAEDIKQNGLMHNIVVGKRGDNGQYTLISGERRYRAFTLLNSQGNAGYKTIPAVVDGEQNPLLVKLKLISANATARELSDYEKSEQAAQIEQIAKQLKQQGLELPGRARDITAQVLGVSPAQAGRLTRIAHDLVPEVKEKFAAGDIGVTEAYDVATLPPEQQVQAVEARAAKTTEDTPSFLTQADIDAFLQHAVQNRLIEIYKTNPSAKDAVDALRKSLINSGGTFDFANSERGLFDCWKKGIQFRNLSTKEEEVVTWTMAHKRILELIADGRIVVSSEDADEEPDKPVEEQPTAEPPKAATLPEQAPKATTKPPYIGTAVRVIPWADGFDTELLEAAQCLEHWNESTPNKHGYGVFKGLILREAAMRKKRTE